MSDVNIQTFSGKVNVSNNFTVGGGHLFVDTQNNKVGLNTNTPDANLHVTGNTYISTDISVGGTLTMGTVTVEALHSLDAVTSVGNTTPHTVEFQNTDTSLVASGNVEMAKELTVSGNATVSSNLTVSGNATVSSNLTVSGNVEVAKELTVSGNATVSSNLTVSGNVEVGTANLFVDTTTGNVGIGKTDPGSAFDVVGETKISSNLEVGTANLFVDTTTGNVGIGTNNPQQALEVHGNILAGPNNVNTFIHGGGQLSLTADGEVQIISDANDTSGAGYSDIIFGYGGSVNIDQARDTTYEDVFPGATGGPRVETMRIKASNGNVEIGGALLIGLDGKDAGDAGNHRKNLFIQSTYNGNTSKNYGWWIGTQDELLRSDDNDLHFSVVRNGTFNEPAYIQDGTSQTQMNFTGQHRTFVKDKPTSQLDTKEGLIVVADQNEFIKMSGGVAYGKDAITINESLPLVTLSTKSNDKRCFGVLSTTEDPETRKEVHGNFVSNMRKEEGDTRVYVNSVGEGAIWVVNTNGTLESGDYITTSNVAGYGMKQDDDILHNYTVAKILMDCDFNPPTQVKRVIKKESRMVDYWVRYGDVKITEEEYQTLPETRRKIIEDVHYRIDQIEVVKENPEMDTFVYEQREEMVNVLDEHGEFQWEETDETEKAYTLRYLDADGNITDEANAVHTAAFVGCTYHCG